MKKLLTGLFIVALLVLPIRASALTQEEYQEQMSSLISQLVALVQQLQATQAANAARQEALLGTSNDTLGRIERNTSPNPRTIPMPDTPPVSHRHVELTSHPTSSVDESARIQVVITEAGGDQVSCLPFTIKFDEEFTTNWAVANPNYRPCARAFEGGWKAEFAYPKTENPGSHTLIVKSGDVQGSINLNLE